MSEEVTEVAVSPTITNSANFDTQVATAKRFPRSISRFMQHAQEMAILSPDIAASCIYAIPRDGRTIEGPSARLAEIVAHSWGNLRIQASAGSDSDGRFIIGRGEAWDVETNVAIAYEVRRRITGRNNAKFSDDMIAVTGNAAASIALRNAVFKAVPSAFWKPIYNKCREVVAGKAETFHARRENMLKQFAIMGVTKEQVCGLLSVRGVMDITLEHMVTLTGVFNALKEGEITIEETFLNPSGPITAPGRKSDAPAAAAPAAETKQEQATAVPEPVVEQAQTTQPEPAKEAAKPAEEAKPDPVEQKPVVLNVGRIASLEANGVYQVVKLDTGFTTCFKTENADMLKSVQNLKAAERVVELEYIPSKDPSKFMSKLTGIEPLPPTE